ncbi:MAG: hypothetical protein M1836_001799 [Candelina mexicana]|nr:MAG: hypothetical protein M1836_001799 [Candelina mexicana]
MVRPRSYLYSNSDSRLNFVCNSPKPYRYIKPNTWREAEKVPKVDYTMRSDVDKNAKNTRNIDDGSHTEAATGKPQPFRFLDLPRELRDQIYQHSLVSDGYIQHPAKYKFQAIPELGVNLLRTCRQIHNEASQVLYGYNTFQIRPSDTKRGRPGVGWLDQFGTHNCANIKRIEIVTRGLARFTYAQLEKLCAALPNLTTIVVVVLWRIIEDSAADWLRINCLLQNKPQTASIAWDTRNRKRVIDVLARVFPGGYQRIDSRFIAHRQQEAAWEERGPRRLDYESDKGSWATESDKDEEEEEEEDEDIEWDTSDSGRSPNSYDTSSDSEWFEYGDTGSEQDF